MQPLGADGKQTSNAVLMVRPASFGFNPETAATNAFATGAADPQLALLAEREFDAVAERLSNAGIELCILEDSPDPPRPDAAFPNNWVSFHADGTIVLYPMAAPTRRLERRPEALIELLANHGFAAGRTIDLTRHEAEQRFLEGTGSLVLDRPRRRAYAALGPRTDREVVAEFDAQLGYSTFLFDAADRKGRPIYHTNVLLSLSTRFALLCIEAVVESRRHVLIEKLEESGRTVIPVDYDQMRRFTCNAIELENKRGERVLALSSTARSGFRPEQIRALETLGGELVDADIPTIERVGGGSVRCMIADIHLPRG